MTTPTPTQVARPWRATARTAFAVIVALAAMREANKKIICKPSTLTLNPNPKH